MGVVNNFLGPNQQVQSSLLTRGDMRLWQARQDEFPISPCDSSRQTSFMPQKRVFKGHCYYDTKRRIGGPAAFTGLVGPHLPILQIFATLGLKWHVEGGTWMIYHHKILRVNGLTVQWTSELKHLFIFLVHLLSCSNDHNLNVLMSFQPRHLLSFLVVVQLIIKRTIFQNVKIINKSIKIKIVPSAFKGQILI